MRYLVIIFMLTLAGCDNRGYSVCTLDSDKDWTCTDPVWSSRDGEQFKEWNKVSCHKLGSTSWMCLNPVSDPRDYVTKD